MLGRFGFHFRSLYNQGQVNKQGVFFSMIVPELTNGFKKRKRLDVTHCSTDFHNTNIGVRSGKCFCLFVKNSGSFCDGIFDFINHMRNHLHSRTQIITGALLANNGVIYLTGCAVMPAGQHSICVALIMSQVQICFRAVHGDKNLTMLKWVHGAGINIDVGIKLHQADCQSP